MSRRCFFFFSFFSFFFFLISRKSLVYTSRHAIIVSGAYVMSIKIWRLSILYSVILFHLETIVGLRNVSSRLCLYVKRNHVSRVLEKTNDETLVRKFFFLVHASIGRNMAASPSFFHGRQDYLSDYIVFISFGAKRTRGSARSRMTWFATVTVTDGTWAAPRPWQPRVPLLDLLPARRWRSTRDSENDKHKRAIIINPFTREKLHLYNSKTKRPFTGYMHRKKLVKMLSLISILQARIEIGEKVAFRRRRDDNVQGGTRPLSSSWWNNYIKRIFYYQWK